MSIARSKSRKTARDTPTRKPVAAGASKPDLRAAQKLVLALMAIPGRSGEEGPVREFIVDELRADVAEAAEHRETRARGRAGHVLADTAVTPCAGSASIVLREHADQPSTYYLVSLLGLAGLARLARLASQLLAAIQDALALVRLGLAE